MDQQILLTFFGCGLSVISLFMNGLESFGLACIGLGVILASIIVGFS